MGIITNNYIMKGVSGKIDDTVVIRQRGGLTILAKAPRKYDIKSDKRKESSDRFRDATKFAKRAMFDRELKKHYQQQAGNDRKPFNVALGDYLDVPVAELILTATYTGDVGSSIVVFTKKGKTLKDMKVSITNKEGQLVEVGLAVQEPGSTRWNYTATTHNGYSQGTITVELIDFAANQTTQVATYGENE